MIGYDKEREKLLADELMEVMTSFNKVTIVSFISISNKDDFDYLTDCRFKIENGRYYLQYRTICFVNVDYYRFINALYRYCNKSIKETYRIKIEQKR